MSDIIINLGGDVSGLKIIENSLESIIAKEGQVGDKWKQTAQQMADANKTSVDAVNRTTKSVEGLVNASKQVDKAIIGGAYKKSLEDIQVQMGLTNKQMVEYILNAKKIAQADLVTLQQWKASEDEIKKVTQNISVMDEQLSLLGKVEETVTGKTTSLRTQLREMREQLAGMTEGTPQFEALRQKAGQLDDKIRDLNQSIRGVGSDTKNLDGLISLATGAAGGFAVAQGSMALFGDESEDMQKALLKVNAAMSILQGLQAVQNVLQKESSASLLFNTGATQINKAALIEKAVAEATATATAAGLTAAEIAQAGATAAATAATKGLNIALLANPITAVLVGVLALVTAIDALNSSNHSAEILQREINDAIREGTIFLDFATEAQTRAADVAIAHAKLRGASAVELSKIEGDSAKRNLELTKEQADATRKKVNENITLFNKLAQFGISADKKTLEEHKKLEDNLLVLDLKYQTDADALRVKGLEHQRLINDQTLEDFIAFNAAKVAATVAGSDAERVAQIKALHDNQIKIEQSADFKALSEGKKAEQQANVERQIQGLQLQNYQHYLKGRTSFYDAYIANAKTALLQHETDTIESINRITDLEIEAAKKRKAEALSNPVLNAGEQEKIVREANLQIAQLEKEKELKILDIQKSGINARLIASEKGSQDEFDTRIDLINKEQQIELAAIELAPEKRLEIETKFQKQREEASRSFNESQLQNQISLDNAALERFGIMEDEKLVITLKRLGEQQQIEISQAQGNAAKIAEINAKYDAQRIAAKKASIAAELALNIKAFDTLNEIGNRKKEAIISDPLSSPEAKRIANDQLLANEEFKTSLKLAALKNSKLLEGTQEYEIALQEIKNEEDANNLKHSQTALQIFKDEQAKKLAILQSAIDTMQTGIDQLDTGALKTGLTSVLNLYTQIGKAIAANKEAKKDPNADQEQADKDEENAIRGAAIVAIQATISQVFADAAAQRQQELADNLSALEDQKNKELSNANLTSKQKQEIEARYRQKERQVKIAAFNADKQAKSEEIIINGALAIVKAAPNLILMAVMAAMTAIQLAVVNSQPTPKFKHGQIDIQGPGTSTSDSIHAKISKGESVMPRRLPRNGKKHLWQLIITSLKTTCTSMNLFTLMCRSIFNRLTIASQLLLIMKN